MTSIKGGVLPITPQPILGAVGGSVEVQFDFSSPHQDDDALASKASCCYAGVPTGQYSVPTASTYSYNNNNNNEIPYLYHQDPLQEEAPHHQRVRPHPTYGLNAPRQWRTDVFCVPIFVAFMALFVVLSSVVLYQGNPDTLFYGVDKFGNSCGHNQQHVNVTGLGADPWETRTNIWYPLQFTKSSSPSSALASIDSELSIGVCVRKCPKAGDALTAYAQGASSSSSSSSFGSTYLVLYDSFPVMNRCIPNVSSLLCDTLASCNNYRVNAPTATAPANASIGGLAELRNTATSSVKELYDYWWVILFSMLLAMMLSYGWMFALLCIKGKAMVTVITTALAVVVFFVGGGICWVMRKNSDDAEFWKAGAWTCWDSVCGEAFP